MSIDYSSARVKIKACQRKGCGMTVLEALDDYRAGILVRCDPIPLSPAAELEALKAGRLTYELVTIGNDQELVWRSATRIRWRTTSQRGRLKSWPVVATHVCGSGVPVAVVSDHRDRERLRHGQARSAPATPAHDKPPF